MNVKARLFQHCCCSRSVSKIFTLHLFLIKFLWMGWYKFIIVYLKEVIIAVINGLFLISSYIVVVVIIILVARIYWSLFVLIVISATNATIIVVINLMLAERLEVWGTSGIHVTTSINKMMIVGHDTIVFRLTVHTVQLVLIWISVSLVRINSEYIISHYWVIFHVNIISMIGSFDLIL